MVNIINKLIERTQKESEKIIELIATPSISMAIVESIKGTTKAFVYDDIAKDWTQWY